MPTTTVTACASTDQRTAEMKRDFSPHFKVVLIVVLLIVIALCVAPRAHAVTIGELRAVVSLQRAEGDGAALSTKQQFNIGKNLGIVYGAALGATLTLDPEEDNGCMEQFGEKLSEGGNILVWGYKLLMTAKENKVPDSTSASGFSVGVAEKLCALHLNGDKKMKKGDTPS